MNKHRWSRQRALLSGGLAFALILTACDAEADDPAEEEVPDVEDDVEDDVEETDEAAERDDDAAAEACPEPVDVTFAQLLSVTGPIAEFVEPHFNAAEMAIQDAEDEGVNVNVNVVTEDVVNTPEDAVSAFERALREEPSAVYGAPLSTQTEVIAAGAADADTILLAPNAIEVAGFGPKSFNAIPTFTEHQVPEATDQLLEAFDLETAVYIAPSDYATGQEVNAIREEILQENGVETLGHEETLSEQTDFSSVATRIVNEDPDIVVEDLQNTVVFHQQLRDAGYEGLVFGAGGIGTPTALEAGGEALEGALTFLAWHPESSPTSISDDWVERYEEAYGTVPGQFPPPIYDAIRLFLLAAEQACSDDPGEIAEAMTEVEYSGVTGDPIAFDETQALPADPVLVRIEDGSYVPVLTD